ncbi:hypothetical protein SNOG_02965 [Parastagonospora nodorum SN15]|uniref:Uncharacterized protein n=1 Tax=Phaeosphaeria nodorum (strain SN15 / ATCC MYA-4574 / FGSC 10173) TaxID=321614 RepID=Q0UZ49_PHANO|nr:hypothetical protein SNOG_02965 [Parastagonospora nodorum SN15]EAT89696.1 hypothetical protein SNOG_02965 [Parastagonospora nodorum SN15]
MSSVPFCCAFSAAHQMGPCPCVTRCTQKGRCRDIVPVWRPRLRRADTGKKSAPLPSHACRTLASGASSLTPLWTHIVWGFRLKFEVVRKKARLPETVVSADSTQTTWSERHATRGVGPDRVIARMEP